MFTVITQCEFYLLCTYSKKGQFFSDQYGNSGNIYAPINLSNINVLKFLLFRLIFFRQNFSS